MTGSHEPQQDGSIQAMLCDSGLEAATELRRSLEELRALVPDRAPAPRADLAALLAAGSPAPAAATTVMMPAAVAAPDSADEALPAGVVSLAERRGRKRRLAIVGGAVVAAMTLGAGAVAASSEDFRASVSQSVGIVFQPSGQTPDKAPQPLRPSPADLPAASVPSDASVATTPPAADEAGVVAPGPAAEVPGRPGAAATPPAIGRGGVLPTPPRRPVTPGIPGLPVIPATPGLPDPGEERDAKEPAPILPGQPQPQP